MAELNRVVKVRVSGLAEDADKISDALARAGIEVLDRSAPYANRRDPGVRVYFTVLMKELAP